MYPSKAEKTTKPTLWRKAAAFTLVAAGAVSAVVTGVRTTYNMERAQAMPVSMGVGQAGTRQHMEATAANAFDFLSSQGGRSVLISASVGVVAAIGLGLASFIDKRVLARSEARQATAAQEAARQQFVKYYVGRAMEIEATRPKTMNEMTLGEETRVPFSRDAEPLGNGLYRSKSYRHGITTGLGDRSIGLVTGPIEVAYLDNRGYEYLQNLPTAEYPLAAAA